MSSAIDFDFHAITMQSGAAPFHTNAKERLASLPPASEYQSLDYRQQRAYRATQGDQPYAPDEPGCCGLFQNYGPSGRIIEFVSFLLSLACLIGTFGALIAAYVAEPEHDQRPRFAEVRICAIACSMFAAASSTHFIWTSPSLNKSGMVGILIAMGLPSIAIIVGSDAMASRWSTR